MAIKYLEKPKGCLKTLKLLDKEREITIRRLIKRASLSQNGAYSSISHLENLNLIETSSTPTPRGTRKIYRPTERGEELLHPLSVFFDSLRLISKKESIDMFLDNPYRTLEILLKTYRRGCVTLTYLVRVEGMCKSTACSCLKSLTRLGVLKMEIRKSSGKTRKEYSLTEKGQILGRVLFIVNEKMGSLLSFG